MRKNSAVLAVLLTLGLLVCMSTGAWAFGNNLPYYDNFDDGDAAGWNVISGDWSVLDGEYYQDNYGSNGGQTPYGLDQMTALAGIPQSDYVVQADMRLEEANYTGWWGLIFRYQDSSNYYTILLYTTPSYSYLEFWTFLDGRWSIVDEAQVDVDPYAMNTLRADVEGNVFDFYLNGEFVFQSTDDALSGGDVGLYTERTRASFDNWRMSRQDWPGMLPYYDDFSDGNADGWTLISGDWSVQQDEYHQDNSYYNGGQTPYGWDQMSLLGVLPESDYVIQADVRLDETNYSGWWGLVFRYQDSSNYYSLLLYTTPTYTRLEFWTYLNERWQRVDWQIVDIDPYAWNTLRADVEGNVFDFYLNGEFMFQSTHDALADGDVGFYTEDTRASFDNWRMFGEFATIDDIIAEVGVMCSAGNIDNQGIANSLTAKLDAALKSLERGNVHAAKNTLLAFINALEAQAGKHVSEDAAARLIDAAYQILATL